MHSRFWYRASIGYQVQQHPCFSPWRAHHYIALPKLECLRLPLNIFISPALWSESPGIRRNYFCCTKQTNIYLRQGHLLFGHVRGQYVVHGTDRAGWFSSQAIYPKALSQSRLSEVSGYFTCVQVVSGRNGSSWQNNVVRIPIIFCRLRARPKSTHPWNEWDFVYHLLVTTLFHVS